MKTGDSGSDVVAPKMVVREIVFGLVMSTTGMLIWTTLQAMAFLLLGQTVFMTMEESKSTYIFRCMFA